MVAHADSTAFTPETEEPGTTPKSIGSAQEAGKPCYCENRDCTCTPEIVQRIETIFTPEPTSDAEGLVFEDRSGFERDEDADDDWPVMPFITPLTYSDALDLVDGVLAHDFNRVLLRDRLAHLLMTVDCESRKQERVVFGGPDETDGENQ